MLTNEHSPALGGVSLEVLVICHHPSQKEGCITGSGAGKHKSQEPHCNAGDEGLSHMTALARDNSYARTRITSEPQVDTAIKLHTRA